MKLSPEEQNKLIGKTLKEVRSLYPKIRITSIGKTPLIGTCDYVGDRLNVSVSDMGLTPKVSTYKSKRTGAETSQTYFDIEEAEEKGIIESIKGWG